MEFAQTTYTIIHAMLLILDVDGVLTDGKKYYDNTGKAVLKTFCDRDFTAIKKFKAAGWSVVLLSGDRNINECIAKNRNIDFYCNRNDGIMTDKVNFIELFEQKYKCDRDNMVYVGDDIFDINILRNVGYAFCPEDAAFEVKQVSKIINAKGGEGCVDELYKNLIRLQLLEEPTLDKVMVLDQNERF